MDFSLCEHVVVVVVVVVVVGFCELRSSHQTIATCSDLEAPIALRVIDIFFKFHILLVVPKT